MDTGDEDCIIFMRHDIIGGPVSYFFKEIHRNDCLAVHEQCSSSSRYWIWMIYFAIYLSPTHARGDSRTKELQSRIGQTPCGYLRGDLSLADSIAICTDIGNLQS